MKEENGDLSYQIHQFFVVVFCSGFVFSSSRVVVALLDGGFRVWFPIGNVLFLMSTACFKIKAACDLVT